MHKALKEITHPNRTRYGPGGETPQRTQQSQLNHHPPNPQPHCTENAQWHGDNLGFIQNDRCTSGSKGRQSTKGTAELEVTDADGKREGVGPPKWGGGTSSRTNEREGGHGLATTEMKGLKSCCGINHCGSSQKTGLTILTGSKRPPPHPGRPNNGTQLGQVDIGKKGQGAVGTTPDLEAAWWGALCLWLFKWFFGAGGKWTGGEKKGAKNPQKNRGDVENGLE